MELSSLLFKLLVAGVKLIRENVSLVKSILQILISTLKISLKRKIYQPHLTLSLESFFQIYQTVNAYNTARSGENAELGLKAILMSTPPVDIFHMVTLLLALSLYSVDYIIDFFLMCFSGPRKAFKFSYVGNFFCCQVRLWSWTSASAWKIPSAFCKHVRGGTIWGVSDIKTSALANCFCNSGEAFLETSWF